MDMDFSSMQFNNDNEVALSGAIVPMCNYVSVRIYRKQFVICYCSTSTDTAFADSLLVAAKSLYSFASKNRGKYTDCVHNAAEFYR